MMLKTQLNFCFSTLDLPIKAIIVAKLLTRNNPHNFIFEHSPVLELPSKLIYPNKISIIYSNTKKKTYFFAK